MKFAALGRTRLLYDTIQAALAAGHQLTLLGTCKAAPEYDITEADFQALANRQGCPFFNDSRINSGEVLAMLAASEADIAISVNWLTLIGSEARSLFPLGILNAHMGDLPRYRGNACPNWAILNGEPDVTLTIHVMGEGLDDGDIVTQQRMALTEQTYIADIYRHFGQYGPALFIEAMQGLAGGTIVPTPQASTPLAPLRCYPRRPEDGRIDWRSPAPAIHRLIRASGHPFAGAFTTLEGRQPIVIWRAEPFVHPGEFLAVPGQVLYSIDGDPLVACGQSTALRLTELEGPAGASCANTKGLILSSLRNRLV
ncbi:MAG: formyl transferase [Alphaproteobacteria bacterium]|nr:formyl transferase [Alphaproteobacteria bacterium]